MKKAAVCILINTICFHLFSLQLAFCASSKNTLKAYSGGDTTVFNTSRDAFAKPLSNLPTQDLRKFAFGNRLFNTKWVTAPASVKTFDGLGPTFNRRSCSGCHFKDGRGRPPRSKNEDMQSMLVRLSIPGKDEHGGPLGHPQYGDQLNPKGIMNVSGEGRAYITYIHLKKYFADGEEYYIRIPEYHFEGMAYDDLEKDVMFSPRVANAVFGLGLLEAVSKKTILRLADEKDKNKDGISGRPNYVYDQTRQKLVIGRFGWKANQPSLRQQAAGAALGDIGITTNLNNQENCPEIQKQCVESINGGSPELSDEFLDKLVFYISTLAVPARRNIDDPDVIHGEKVFKAAKCHLCHVPTLKTNKHPIKALSHQKIQPFTDLLLHDMGEALADDRPDYEATGREWRTPPLWGIGLQKTVNKHTYFLHDGRARTLLEAIMWHSGEASSSREYIRNASKADRDALIEFLESL